MAENPGPRCEIFLAGEERWRVEGMLAALDFNGDGQISYNEWLRFMKNLKWAGTLDKLLADLEAKESFKTALQGNGYDSLGDALRGESEGLPNK